MTGPQIQRQRSESRRPRVYIWQSVPSSLFLFLLIPPSWSKRPRKVYRPDNHARDFTGTNDIQHVNEDSRGVCDEQWDLLHRLSHTMAAWKSVTNVLTDSALQPAGIFEPICSLTGYNVRCSERGLQAVPGVEYKKFKTGKLYSEAKAEPYANSTDPITPAPGQPPSTPGFLVGLRARIKNEPDLEDDCEEPPSPPKNPYQATKEITPERKAPSVTKQNEPD